MTNTRRAQRGFTLIELSVVLIIIGLLVSGLVVGRNMIEQATIRAVIAEVDHYSTGVHLFAEKFRQLPGDFTRAEEFWGADSGCPGTAYNETPKTATCDGNGDGLIHIGGSATDYERFRAWQQMANAGVITGKFSGVADNIAPHLLLRASIPASKYAGGGYTILFDAAHTTDANNFAAPARHVLDFGAVDPICPVTSDLGHCSSHSALLFPREAQQIDAKIDDGRPATGKVYSRPKNSSVTPNCTDTAVATTSRYDVDREEKSCSLIFDLEI